MITTLLSEQTIQSVKENYYKVWQILQKVTRIYYKMRQGLQSLIVIAK